MALAQIPQSYVQKCKIVAHVFQLLFIFIAACITIAVLTKGGFVGGGTRFFFAMCFLSAPALIYLVMVPMWQRTVRFANVYAFIGVDALFTILWLSAFISVAMYNSAGIRQGAQDKSIGENDGNCTTFAYGPEDKCTLSRATVGLGAVVFILFLLTTAISAYWATTFRKSGTTPFGGMTAGAPNGRTQAPDFEAQKVDDANAWSADTHDIDGGPAGGRSSDEYVLLNNANAAEHDEARPHTQQSMNWGSVDNADTSYAGAQGGHHGGRYDDEHDTAYGGYQDYRNEAAGRPQAQGNYSFSGGDYR